MRTLLLPVDDIVAALLRGPRGIAQRTEAWYEARLSYITASEVPTAVGENHNKNVEAYVLEKAGMAEPFRGNFMTEWGERHEDEAVALYEARTGERVFDMGLVQHPRVSWIAGSPDGVTLSGKLVEVKCPYGRRIQRGVVPAHYMGQVQCLMDILGLQSCDFVQYWPGSPKRPEQVFDVTTIPYDPEYMASRLEQLAAVRDRFVALRSSEAPAAAPPPKRQAMQIVVE